MGNVLTRGDVTVGTGNNVAWLFWLAEGIYVFGEAKICKIRIKLGTNQDVVCFDITVDYGRCAVVVKIGHSLCSSEYDLESRLPVHEHLLLVEQLEQTTIANEIKHEQSHLPVGAAAYKPHDVLVSDRPKRVDLRSE